MAKRGRKAAFTPLIKWIIAHWFRPWAKNHIEGPATTSTLETMFGCHYRSIQYLKARTSLRVEGDILIDGRPVPGIKAPRDRTVRQGGRVWVRSDTRENYIEIETNRAVFRLPRSEGLLYVEKNFIP